jgi:hypothetical protein
VTALPGPEASGYRRAFQAAYASLSQVAQRLAEVRGAAPALYRELARHPAEQRRLLVRNGGRFSSWGLAELLLAEAQRRWDEEPAAAEQAARLAVEVLGTLAPERDSRPFVEDLKARAAGWLAQAHLARGEEQAAADALRQARGHLARGSGDLLEEAHVLEVEALLERARGSLDSAVLAQRRAVVAFRRAGENALAAQALLGEAALCREAGETARALSLLVRARDLLGGREAPRLLLSIERRRISLLRETGREREAAAVLAEARRLALRLGDRAELLRLRQAEGRAPGLPEVMRSTGT